MKNLFDYSVQNAVKNLFDYSVQNEVKNLSDYNVQNEVKNLSDTSLTLSMTLSVILREVSCHSEPLYGVKNLRGHDGGSLHKDYKGRVAQTAQPPPAKMQRSSFTKFN